MTGRPKNVLITSVSRKVPMMEAVRKALRKVSPSARLFVADSDGSCLGRHFADGFWHQPPMADLGLEQFLAFCRSKGIRWVIPSRDGELERLAEWREELSGLGVEMMISDSPAVGTCRDKLAFAKRLAGLSGVLPASPRPVGGEGLRWVVKERRGAGSRRIVVDCSPEEAEDRAAGLAEPVFQPYIEGREYSVDVYIARSGHPWGCVIRSRDLVQGGESQVTTVCGNPALEELCLKAAAILRIRHHAVFQAIEDGAGQLHLIECNPRFGGASTLSVRAGLDSFFWFFCETTDSSFHPGPFVRGVPGLRLYRYPADRFRKVRV